MRGVVAWSLTVEISMDCGNLMLAAENIFLIRFLKLKYFGTFTNITPTVHSNAHLNTLKGIGSDKLLIIVEIYNCQFLVMLNSIKA